MELPKKSNRILLTWVGLAVILTVKIYAVEIKDRYTPIHTFQDDRAAGLINENFRRVTENQIDDKGFNVSIVAESNVTTITFVNAQTDTGFGIFVQATWDANPRVLQKSTTGFQLGYSTPAAGNRLDWIMVR